MKRKVIQLADTTQGITLPRKWSVSHNLKKGEFLEVEDRAGFLVVKSLCSSGDAMTLIS